MLKGIDVSSWQENMNFNPYDFVIIKASEGNNWVDPGLNRHFNNLAGNESGKPLNDKNYGFYHYARPELGETPETEAEWFVSLVGHHANHAIFALDWEGNSLKYSPEWALRWLDRVYELTKVKPLIYLQASEAMLGKYKIISDKDYGLWVAHWGTEKPAFGNWSVYALHQYDNTPLDYNYFNGDSETWAKYAGKYQLKPIPEKNEITMGDTVKVLSVKDYDGNVCDPWVLRTTFDVIEVNKNRIVIGKGNIVTGAWNAKDIKKV